MQRYIITLFSLTFMLISLNARDPAPQPIVTQFLTEELTVYEHLSTILESAMQLAIEHNDAEDLHNNVATREIILNKAMTGFLDFDVQSLDEEFVDSNVENFVGRVVTLFKETSVDKLSVEVQSIEDTRPDTEEVSGRLRQIMIGYYFAHMKESNFDESQMKVDWRFNEIQQKMQGAITQKLNELAKQFQTMMFNEMVLRAKNFTASFKVHHQQVVFILKSFKNYAMRILIEQLRTFYFEITQNPNAVEPQKAKDVFQRTIDMWMIAYKLCERDCEPETFASFIPNFLEDLMMTRIEQNTNIVASPLVKTFFAKFLAFLYQQNFQNNTPEEVDDELMNLNESYAMFIYRLFFSKGSRKMNKQLSNFMNDVYRVEGLNFMFPSADLKQQDPQEFARRTQLNQQYIVDLILHLDFPELDNEEVQDADKERTQPVSFTEEDTLTLVQAAHVWFALDLDKLNTEDLILNWFVDYKNVAAFEDYQVMYETLGEFRRTFAGEEIGEELDLWLNTTLVDTVSDLPRDDKKRTQNLSQYWLMKSINMINILSGDEYDEIFTNAYEEDVNEDIILFFRRIVQREEFEFLKKAMLQIYAYYKEDGKVYTTDLEDDKFLYEVFDMSIECEKLPEILGTEVTTINVTFKDDEHVMDINRKRELDNGSDSNKTDESSPEIVHETSSNSSSQVSEHKSVDTKITETMDRQRNNDSVHSSNVNIIPLVSNHSSEKTKEESVKQVIVESENSSQVVIVDDDSDESSHIQKDDVPENKIETSELDKEEVSEHSKSVKSVISKKSSNAIVEVSSSNNSSEVNSSKKSTPKTSELNRQNDHPVQDPSYTSSQKSENLSQNSTSPVVVVKESEHNSHEKVETSSNTSTVEVIEQSSSNSSQVVDIEETSESSQLIQKKSKISSHKSDDISENESSHHNEVIETSENSSNIVSQKSTDFKTPENKSTQSDTLNETKSKKNDVESESVHSSVVNESELSRESPNKKIEVSSNSSYHTVPNTDVKEVIEVSSHSSNKSMTTPEIHEVVEVSSHSSNKSRTSHDDQEVVEVSSESSHDSRQVSHKTEQKSHKTISNEIEEQIDDNSSSNTSSHSNNSSEKSSVILPVVPSHKSEIVEEISETIDHEDDLNVKKNLVYEVTGRLTNEQRKTFELADDVYASIKDLKIQTDENGQEVEYVYVQIVRKNSDCYEELLRYV